MSLHPPIYYDLDTACLFTHHKDKRALVQWLSKHRDEYPKRYRRDRTHRRVRILSGEDIRRIQAHQLENIDA